MTNDMTKDSPIKLILSFMVPLLIGNIFQQFYNMADTIIVGRTISVEALAAVGATGSISFLIVGFVQGVTSGFAVITAQRFGAGSENGVRRSVATSIILGIAVTIVMTAISVLAARPLLEIMKTPSDIIDDSYNYIIVIFEGIAAAVFFNLFSSILRSLGDSKTPLVFLIIASIINIILDPIMIFGYFGLPAMGAAGAAIATVIGQCIAALLAIYYNLKKNPDIQLSLKGFRPEGDVIGRILSIAVPSIAMVAVGSVMTYGFNRILFTFTPIAVSVFGIFYKVQSMAFMPVFGLNNGMIPIVSYNYGAKQPDRMLKAVKYTMMAAICFMLLCLTAMQVIPDLILKVFDAQEDMMAIGIPALRTMSISFLFAGICIVSSGMFQALGKGVYSLIVSLARQLIVLLPVAYAFAKFTRNLELVWLSFPIAEVGSVILSIAMALQTKKKIIDPLKNSVKTV